MEKGIHYADFMEKAMATHSSTLAWEIPWMEEPGRLSPWGHEESDTTSNFTFTFHFHALEKEMATHSIILAWIIPGTGAWWATIYGVAQSRTWLMWLSSSSSMSQIVLPVFSSKSFIVSSVTFRSLFVSPIDSIFGMLLLLFLSSVTINLFWLDYLIH